MIVPAQWCSCTELGEAEEEQEEAFEIYQTDFECWYVSIRESGTCKIMKYIVFDFNLNEESPDKFE